MLTSQAGAIPPLRPGVPGPIPSGRTPSMTMPRPPRYGIDGVVSGMSAPLAVSEATLPHPHTASREVWSPSLSRRHRRTYAHGVDASTPVDADTLDDLAERLGELRLQAGNPSFAEIARLIRILREKRGVRSTPPGRVTVYDAFRTGRSRMDIELVADIVAVLGHPSDIAAWRQAHAQILRRRARERNGRISTARAAVTRIALDDLPTFVAHEAECEALVDLLIARGGGVDPLPRIALVTGLPGIGKSVFARAVARRVADRMDAADVIEAALRSHTAGSDGTPDPGEVSAEILRVHGGSDAAGDTVVVLLDDVTSLDDVSIVASVLPEAWTIIATSRRGFETPPGLAPIVLEPLEPERAVRMLAALAPPVAQAPPGDESPVDAVAPDALARLATFTGGLPLGIALLASQLTARSGWSIEDHVARLESSSGASLAPTLTAAFAQLTPGPRHALHLLAQHPGRLNTDEVRAYLRGVAAAAAERWSVDEALEELLRENFLTCTPNGRHEMHDVVRSLAVESARVEEPLSLRRAAAGDLSRDLEASLRRSSISSATIPEFVETTEAHVSTVALAGGLGLFAEATAHAGSLHPWLETATRWNDIILINEYLRRLAPPADRPDVERRLSGALLSVGREDEAEVILTNLLEATRETDPVWYRTVAMLSDIANLHGSPERTVELAETALEGARAAEDGPGIIWASGVISQALNDLGRAPEAVRTLDAALLAYPCHDTPLSRIPTLIDLGVALYWADRIDDARAQFDAARHEADALGHRGMTLFCEGWIGCIDVTLGKVAEGRAALVRADEGLEQSGRKSPRSWIKMLLARACLADGDTTAAARVAADGLAICEERGFDHTAGFCLVILARVAIAEGRDDDARTILERVRDGTSRPARILSLEELGILADRRGDRDAAIALWETSLSMGPGPLPERWLRERIAAIAA